MNWWDEYPDADTAVAEAPATNWWDEFPDAPENDKPFFNLSNTGEALWDAVTGLGVTVPAAYRQMREGMVRPDQYSPEAQEAFAASEAYNRDMAAKTQAAQAAGQSDSVSESIREAGSSLGFTALSMGASVGGGAATGAAVGSVLPGLGTGAGGVIGALGGMAASGTAAYRMAGAQFLGDAFAQLEQTSLANNGRPMSEEEKAAAYAELLPIAQNSSLWEAGPEAIGNMVTLGTGKILFNIGKPALTALAKSALGKAGIRAGAAAAGVGTELATETATQVEQNAAQQKAAQYAAGQPMTAEADWTPEGVATSFKEVAPQTLALTAMLGGAGAGIKTVSSMLSPSAPTAQNVPQGTIGSEEADMLGSASPLTTEVTADEVRGVAPERGMPPPEVVQQEVDTATDDWIKAEDALRKAQAEGEQQDVRAAQQEAQRAAGEARAARERQRQYEEMRRQKAQAEVVDAATNAIMVAEEAAPIAPATAETLAQIAEQTAVETLASQPDDRAIIAWAITQEKLGVKVPGMNEYDLNNYSENFSTATKNRAISQMREAYNQSLNEPTPETITEQPIPVGQTQVEVAPETPTLTADEQPTAPTDFAVQQPATGASVLETRPQSRGEETGARASPAAVETDAIRAPQVGSSSQAAPVAPGSRVTFMQEGVQRTGELVSLNAGVARVKGDDGVVVQTRAQNITPIESNENLTQSQPPESSVLGESSTVPRTSGVPQPSAFSTYLRTVTPTGKWTDNNYAAAQRFADGDQSALQDLSKVKRNAVVRELLAFDAGARARQDAEDKRIADDFKARNKERPSDAPLLDEALAKISEPLPDDIESASIGGGEAPTAFRSEADYQQELTNRLGITNFSNIVFGNFDPLENGVSLKGFVKQGSDKVYLNLRNLQSAEDMVDVYLEEATHLVWTSPEVADAWARLRELVPDAQLQALRAEMDARGYAEGVLDEEAFNEIARTKGFEWLNRSEWRKFWDAVKAAVRRILGLTDTQEIDRVSARLVSYAIANQQSMTEEAAASGESREISPFRVDDIARMSIAPDPDEQAFRDAVDPRMAARQASANFPGTPQAKAAAEAGESMETSRARFIPMGVNAASFLKLANEVGLEQAEGYLGTTPMDQALDAMRTGSLPLGLRSGEPGYKILAALLTIKLSDAENAATDDLLKAQLHGMAYEAARLGVQEGTSNARSQQAGRLANALLQTRYPELATKQILEERQAKVIDTRMGEKPDEGFATIEQGVKGETGKNVGKDLDESEADLDTEEEDALTAAERHAQRLIYKTEERLRQGSKDLTTNKDGDTINRAFREQVTDPMEQQAFRDRLQALNVGAAVADRLFLTASREAQDKAAMKVYQAARNLRRKTETLLAKDSPALVRLINDLRKKMFPGMTWTEILTDLPSAQRERQTAIRDRLLAHTSLNNLNAEEIAQLTNELNKAWQRERQKLILRELSKEGILGTKSAVDRQKVKNALPALLRSINLGMFNSQAFREAVGPQYGLRNLTAVEAKELRELGQEAWNLPEGLPRKRALQNMLNKVQKIAGVSRLELLESYWISSVLSGFRTQFDTWGAIANGFATISRLSATLPLQGKRGGLTVMAEYFKGLPEAMNEAFQILRTGDRAWLKNNQSDLMQALSGHSPYRSSPISERMFKEGNIWQKFPALVMVMVSRSMSAADHMNNTMTSRGARAVARALHPEIYKGALTPTAQERADARAQAIREMTGGVEPKTLKEKADVSNRTRELLDAVDIGPAPVEGNAIGDIASYQSDPTGLFGWLYNGINHAFGSLERGARAKAENPDVNALVRAIAAFAAVSSRAIAGVRFARFGMNFASNSTSFLPGTYFARKALYGDELSRSRESLILANNLIGMMGMFMIYAAFESLGGGDEDDYGLEGRWDNLTPERKRQRMSAGVMPNTFWWRDKKTGAINRISYRQWEIGALFAAAGNMLDKKKYNPGEWKNESFASHTLVAVAAGLLHVRDLSALTGLIEILGESAYATDPGEEVGKKINKISSNWVTALLPNAFRDIDAWNDPQHYKAKDMLSAWTKGVPVLRRTVAGGRPMLTLLGDPVELDRSPWSRVYTNASQDEGYQALGALHARGIWMPAPSTERIVRNANGDKVRISDLGGEAEWTYQKAVGKAYRKYLKDNDADLRAMSVDDAEKQLAKDTERIRDDAARELEDSL